MIHLNNRYTSPWPWLGPLLSMDPRQWTWIESPKIRTSSDFWSFFDGRCKNIEIKPNISFKQFQSLFNFKKEKNFRIINCDKNVGNAFISNNLYNTSAYNFLNSDTTFERLLSNPLEDTVNYINTEIQNLCDHGHLSEKLRKNILYDINTCAKWSSEKNLNNVHNLLIYY